MSGPSLTLPRTSLTAGDRVCVAVSGGADSTALLLLVHDANTNARNALGVGLSVVHVHHGLRGEEADADESFVRELCERLQIPLLVQRVDTAGHAAAHRESIEEAARNLRYACFRGLIAEGRADAVLTAHTLDDQSETVLMKLLRGAWTEGLAAISPVLEVPRGRILRPLLSVRRAEVEGYLRARGQVWQTDSSNADAAYTRNRVRHSVLPMLREENPAVDQTLANLAEIAREEEARWQVELARLLPQILLPGKPVRGGGRSNSTAPGTEAVAMELERLRTLDPALRRRVLRAAARGIGARLSFEETARILALAGIDPMPTVPSKPGASLKLSGGLTAERSVRELRLSRTPPAGGGETGRLDPNGDKVS